MLGTTNLSDFTNMAESCTQCDFEEPTSDLDFPINEMPIYDSSSIQDRNSTLAEEVFDNVKFNC